MNDYEGQLEELQLPLPIPIAKEALSSSIPMDDETPKRGVLVIDMFSWEEDD